jgi:thymidine kinase
MRVGSITVVSGPMFSGKTSELQELAGRAITAGHDILYLIPDIDTRYDANPKRPLNTSHDGTTLLAARIYGSLESVNPPDHITHIFIDEAQFVHGVEAYALRQRDAGKSVYVACLRTGYTGDIWPHTNNLISAHANHFITKTGVCIVCSRDAIYTRLKTGSVRGAEPKVLIGGDELYACVCHEHMYEPETLDDAVVQRRAGAVQRLREMKG